MHWMGGYNIGHLIGLLIMILFWVLVIVGIGWAASFFISKRNAGENNVESPEVIAKKRYASGEIDEDKMNKILRNLKNN